MTQRTHGTQGTVLSATSLKGTNVVNAAGEELGSIKELMLHTDTGDVAYAVLGYGGYVGLGNKLLKYYAVPWKALSVDPETKRIVLDVPRERLEGAPSIDTDADDGLLTPEESWMEELHRHFGYDYDPRRR